MSNYLSLKRKSLFLFLIFTALLVFIPNSARAVTYSFSVPEMTVDVYWNEDGTSSIDYNFSFVNDNFASPIDFVDVGVPNNNYDLNSVYAEVNGQPVTDIAESPYIKPGVAVGLGSKSIQPGESGRVRVYIGRVNDVLYPDTSGDNYASAVFKNSAFDSSFVHGPTNLTLTYHLPPGVQPTEPRWHQSPPGFSAEPLTGIDDKGRITYTWQNPSTNGYTQYEFGASFPTNYIPESTIVRPSPFAWVIPLLIPLLCIGLIVLAIMWVIKSDRRRKMQYLPPKIAIEGHGIKRGLTAVEAAILLEQPMDKIMTMILFGAIKKNAARVVTRDPLEVERIDPLPPELQPYEQAFLAAFKEPAGAQRQKALQKTMIDLVKSTGEKLKGFSRKETVAYYRDIIEKAWAQVEAADTPEVKSGKFEELMEWTMLDDDYDRRTRDVFHEGPVFVPVWWPRYDPGFGRAAPSTSPVSLPTGRAGPSLPTLPGSAFAASMVNGVQNFSSKVVGNITDFTSGVTKVTNPPPPPPPPSRSYSGSSRSSGGSSCVCACACACAGCACACAGGGR